MEGPGLSGVIGDNNEDANANGEKKEEDGTDDTEKKANSSMTIDEVHLANGLPQYLRLYLERTTHLQLFGFWCSSNQTQGCPNKIGKTHVRQRARLS